MAIDNPPFRSLCCSIIGGRLIIKPETGLGQPSKSSQLLSQQGNHYQINVLPPVEHGLPEDSLAPEAILLEPPFELRFGREVKRVELSSIGNIPFQVKQSLKISFSHGP
jgi:hypothetical protein